MTAPETTKASPTPAKHRLAKFAARKPLTTRRAAGIIASVTLSITIISGVLMHFTDEKTFPNIGDGLWWAIQTVTTVGYGDLVPTSTVGRLVAALVMLAGIGFLTVVTAVITSTFIESVSSCSSRRDSPITSSVACPASIVSPSYGPRRCDEGTPWALRPVGTER
jgi:voltage-gated potassium channel Kch